jgi:hypothetical protein
MERAVSSAVPVNAGRSEEVIAQADACNGSNVSLLGLASDFILASTYLNKLTKHLHFGEL